MVKKESKRNIWLGVILVLFAGIFIGYFLHAPAEVTEKPFEQKTVDEQRLEWMSEADVIRGDLAVKGMYDCCLEKPCWYCIQKTPGHGEGATCECLSDIMNGEHPCGECIGEILEGHGLKDREIVKLYARAIAHKVGEQHTDHLKGIIADMYNITVEEQI